MRSLVLVLVLAGTAGARAAVDAEDLRRGLAVTHRDEKRAIVRLEPSIALLLQNGEAAHPRLLANGGSVRWEGHLNLTRADTYRFRVLLRGSFKLKIGDKEVLNAEVKDADALLKEGPELRLEAGVLPVVAEFTRLPGAARVELLWSSKNFREEPLPFDVLGHVPDKAPARLKDDTLAEQGRYLAEELSCVKCHLSGADSARIAKGLHSRQGPDLSKVGGRIRGPWMYRFLEAPRKMRPGTIMPELFAVDETGMLERHAVTLYLTSLGGPFQEGGAKPARDSIERGKQLFTSVGCITCHGPAGGEVQKRDDLAQKFTLLPAPVLYPFKGMGKKTTPRLLTAYLMNPHSIHPSGRMPSLLLSEKEASDLAGYLCDASGPDDFKLPDGAPRARRVEAFQRLAPKPAELEAFTRLADDAQWQALGKGLARAKGCYNCHAGVPDATGFPHSPFAKKLEDLAPKKSGCLAEDDKQRGKAPRFGLGEPERKALRAFLETGLLGEGSPAPMHAASVTLQRLNCLACHQRDGEGGLESGLVEQLRKYEKAENAEAVVPPPLTGVGHKLRTPWIREVLSKAGRARPWMGLRMPQFGESVNHLPEGLAVLEGATPHDAIHRTSTTSETVGAGRFLTGKQAFGCVSCHDIAGIPNHGTRGPDLATMTQRVRYDWYQRWMENAQRIQPGTRMPTVFQDGKSQLVHVLKGNADAQGEAVWSYLSLGPTLPLPEGLQTPKGLVLAVKERPAIFRTFLPEAGTRAIAVGYPDGVSLAFDATRCRLSYAWTGNFLDVAPVWNDRGGNPARLLGPRLWTAPAGSPWGLTPNDTPPDFAARAKEPGFGGDNPEQKWHGGPRSLHFEGYATDSRGQPTFRYRTSLDAKTELIVEEHPEPLRSPAGTGLLRRFDLQAPPKQTGWMLAGESDSAPRVLDEKGEPAALQVKEGRAEVPVTRSVVLPQPGGRVVLLRVTEGPKGSQWRLQKSGAKWQAILKLPAVEEAARVQADVAVWVPHRDEPALIRELSTGGR